MKKEKVYELKIEEEDEISGIDSISLVDEPAVEVNFLSFNKEKENFIIPDGESEKYLFMLEQIGEPEDSLLQQGYKPFKIGNFEVQKFLQSNPNASSEWDTEQYRVRYKYILNPEAASKGQKPIEDTTRDFCRDMIRKNYVYRVEDMDNLTNDLGSSALVWRGSFNCRHSWSKILYKKEGDIVNKASVNKNKVDINGFPNDLVPDLTVLDYQQPDTRTRYPSFSKENMESVSDYPDAVKNNAKSVLDWVDENGWGSCGTAVGKQRANQLAKGEPISMETVQRMYSYLSRHKGDLESSKSYSDGCGRLMWNSWGGSAALSWAKSKLEQFGYDVSTLPDYVDETITGKTDMGKQQFQIENDEKRIITGVAMIPNLKIIRKDKNGDPYYVFFSEDTIRMIAEKYMRNMYLQNNDINHNGKAAKDVYVIESWIIEDPETDKSKKYGFELPKGSWMVSMRIKNDQVWKDIKDGKLNGFSVSGFFSEEEAFRKQQEEREMLFLRELAQILKGV